MPVESALAFFDRNAQEYPDSANPLDSLGDAYRTAGRLEEAAHSYEQAVALAEKQGDLGWRPSEPIGSG